MGKVYKGKKVAKGIGHCTTVSPSSYITPYTPLKSDTEEAATTLKKGEVVKIQLGAQIDGFSAIVCDSVLVGVEGEVTGREADLFLATYYANELLLRLMIPPGLVPHGDEEEQKKAAMFARMVDLRNANARGIAFENRRRIVAAFSEPENPTDTGRPEVQGA